VYQPWITQNWGTDDSLISGYTNIVDRIPFFVLSLSVGTSGTTSEWWGRESLLCSTLSARNILFQRECNKRTLLFSSITSSTKHISTTLIFYINSFFGVVRARLVSGLS
jgi:hypothetical protein